MSVEQFWGRIGWLTLSTLDDARRASITGTTQNGPNGSAQFYWVYTSTVAGADRQVRLGSSNATISTVCQIVGILQNTPGPGEACDIVCMGVSKVIAGSTLVTMGTALQASSAPVGQAGMVNAYQTAATGSPIGFALETPASTGAIYSAYIAITGVKSS